MDRSPHPDVLILGAGALGLCTAAVLAGRGARVRVLAPGGSTASSVAAGMLAPALEAAVDQPPADHVVLVRAARDLWPALAEVIGIRLHREGAEWRGPQSAEVRERLLRYGFDAHATPEGVFTADDWRLESLPCLEALASQPGVVMDRGAARRVGGDLSVSLTDGRRIVAGRVVVAVGAVADLETPAPLARLLGMVAPVKGQILRLAAAPPPHVIRAPGVYIAPAGAETIVGATMDVGRADDVVEEAVTEILLARAVALLPELVQARVTAAMVGVRGASPDGLPMAGESGVPGVEVALAPRRNGWLLAPLVARVIADRIEGRPPGPFAAALDPGRFA